MVVIENGSAQREVLKPYRTDAAADLWNGLRNYNLWWRLAWLDVKRRYRRTVIGPFWSTVSLAILVTALGAIGMGLWNVSRSDYVPFLAAGMVVWLMVSSIITESCGLFSGSASLFQQMRFDYSVLAYSLVSRNIIVFGHNLFIYFVAVLLFGRDFVGPTLLLAIPGFCILLLNGIWVALLLGMLCLRFRDVQQLISSLMQIAMFITPIFWPPDVLSGWQQIVFVTINPLYHIIDVVRAPMIGRIPSAETYAFTVVMTIVGWGLTYVLFRRFRDRIAYWS
jgi:ABC-type polysaccharide/polyol phosphate export permease